MTQWWSTVTRIIVREKRKIFFWLKIGVSLGFLFYLSWIIDWTRAITIVRQADLLFLLIVPCILLARIGFAALRWRLILADNNVSFSFWQAYKGYLVGAFYDVLLPGVVGGDIVRIGRSVAQTGCQLGTATATVLLERVGGVFALISIALFSYLFFPSTLLPLLTAETKILLITLFTLTLVGMVLLLLGSRIWVRWLPASEAKLWQFIRSGVQVVGTLRGRTLGMVLILSILFQIGDIAVIFLLSRAIGFTVPFIVFSAIVPLVYIITMIPISLGGLGVREGAFAFLLAQFGVATSDAITLSFLTYSSRIVTAGLGGVLQLLEATHSKSGIVKAASVGKYE